MFVQKDYVTGCLADDPAYLVAGPRVVHAFGQLPQHRRGGVEIFLQIRRRQREGLADLPVRPNAYVGEQLSQGPGLLGGWHMLCSCGRIQLPGVDGTAACLLTSTAVTGASSGRISAMYIGNG